MYGVVTLWLGNSGQAQCQIDSRCKCSGKTFCTKCLAVHRLQRVHVRIETLDRRTTTCSGDADGLGIAMTRDQPATPTESLYRSSVVHRNRPWELNRQVGHYIDHGIEHVLQCLPYFAESCPPPSPAPPTPLKRTWAPNFLSVASFWAYGLPPHSSRSELSITLPDIAWE